MNVFFSQSYDQINNTFNNVILNDNKFNNDCKKLLELIASHYKFDLTIEEDISTLAMEILAFISNIKINKKLIDPIQTKRNLKQFPNIITFLTKNKIHKLIDEKRNHPFVLLLASSKITKKTIKQITKKIDETDDESYKTRLMDTLFGYYHPQIILSNLDKILVGLPQDGTKEIRSLLLNDGFLVALTQLDIYSHFKKNMKYT